MTANDMMTLRALLEKSSDADLLREMIGFTAERTVLLGISKRGSQHLRSLLVHGARSVVRTASGKTDPFNT